MRRAFKCAVFFARSVSPYRMEKKLALSCLKNSAKSRPKGRPKRLLKVVKMRAWGEKMLANFGK